MELQGTLKIISDIQTFASGFQKREIILLTEEQYPQPIQIDFLQDKGTILDHYKIGDQVKVGINIRGREWTNPQGDVRYFNSIVGWRIEKKGENTATPQVEEEPNINASSASSNPTNVSPFAEDDDDLPF